MKQAILAAALFAAITAPAQALDCSGRLRVDEATVCDSKELSRLDRDLNRAYERALNGAENPHRLQNWQRHWLASRRLCDDDERCLRRAYRVQIEKLRKIGG